MQSYVARSAKGYTLIEILIVLFIVSIVAGVALITISNNKSRSIQTFANELTQLLSLAEEQAVLQPAIIGVRVDKDEYHFLSYEQNQKQPWNVLQDTLLTKHEIPTDIEVQLQIAQQKKKNEKEELEEKEEGEKGNMPQIIISTNGDLTPFTIYIGKKNEKPLFKIQGDADGSITNQTL